MRGLKKIKQRFTGRKWRKFKSLKRGYYSFIIIILCYLLSFACPLFIGNDALVIKYEHEYYFPVFRYYPASVFGLNEHGETNYRNLKKAFLVQDNGNFVIMPFYEYGPNENLLKELRETPPTHPTSANWMGTDDRGRDVFARIAYGFNISISFAATVTIFAYFFGIMIGAVSGYFGGKTDITVQRLIEIWATLPFLYIVIIVSSIIVPSFKSLTIIMILFNWVGITFYVRGEVLREKSKDYTSAALAAGAPAVRILFRHILPNSLTPVITFIPFAIVANIGSLVALDFLGFGLPPPTPSWGQLIQQGVFASMIDKWWLVVFPLTAQFITLLLIVFIGESVREAFDPKPYSRLK
jgi:microcin C transport system permease protein